MSKPVYTSKTMGANIVAFAALVANNKWGIPISPEMQLLAIGIMNMALRSITKTAVTWAGGK